MEVKAMEIDPNLVVTLITGVLGLISTFAGAKWGLAKQKAAQLTKLLSSITDAAEDDKVTEAEFQTIVENAKALLEKE